MINSVQKLYRKFDMGYTILKNGCWQWGNEKRSYIYPRLYLENYHTYIDAHVFSYMIYKGDTDKLLVHHKCENQKCVNPDHLELMTRKVHIKLHKAKKTHCKYGHLLEGKNLIPRYDGRRDCRKCAQKRDRLYYYKHQTSGVSAA